MKTYIIKLVAEKALVHEISLTNSIKIISNGILSTGIEVQLKGFKTFKNFKDEFEAKCISFSYKKL